ncbi:zinc finger protein 572 [Betta splendens]|uniref:Zinc finger protein 572 n=1 Tax=Betta splendens TaxID=158456 RepID=A0A6P7KRT9_BETSP|nr:zinc finger protein 572 [Betta splendens]XP_040923895.1 zinc finger protein 572 [Betta splendens]
MSIEYTIDIQLTELGFPDILQSQQTSIRETSRRSSSDGSLSSSHSPTSLNTNANKKKLLVIDPKSSDEERGGAKHASNIQSMVDSAPPEELLCKPTSPAQSLQVDQETGVSELSSPSQKVTTAEQDNGQMDDGDGDAVHKDPEQMDEVVVGDSDDSEVSDMYEEEELEEEEEDEEEEGQDDESGEFPCSVCDLHLSSKFKLQDHMNLHTGVRPYCCAECGKRFCQSYNYRVHLRTHRQIKVERYVCRVCRKDFASQEELTMHLSTTHFENEFYECDRCKRVFTCLRVCELHVRLQKCRVDVMCDTCGRSFSSLKSLARHRNGKCYSTFKCTDCSKMFTKKNALLKHSFSHLGLLPYTCMRCHCHLRLAKLYRQHKCQPQRINCVACLREFLSQDDFQRHKKDTGCWGNQEPKGDEIRCLECGQMFDTKEELKKHAGAHQRVLKCAECGKGFRSALLLMSHMGGHAGQSPCLCQSCGLGFPHQQNYHSHLKTCGQTPQPESVPKKRLASRSSSSETQKLKASPHAPNTAIPTATHAPVLPPAATSPPSKEFIRPERVTEALSADSGQSDKYWKLTLDKEPPPGIKLVLLLPVCPNQTSDVTLPPGVPQTSEVPAIQVQPHVSPVPRNGQLGVSPAFGVPLGNLSWPTGIKQDPECEQPLDLSKKKSAVIDISPLPVKSEQEEYEIPTEDTETNPGEANPEVKTDLRNLTTCSTTS